MRRLVVVLLLCGPALVPAVVRAAPDPAEVPKWIEQLGNDDPARRQEAARRLQEIGEPALEPLRKTAKEHEDPDVRLRALLVIRDIEHGPYAEVRSISGTISGYWLNRVAFTADGRRAVAAGGAVIVYDLEKGEEVSRTLELQFAREGLALSRDGRYFLTGHTRENVVRLGEVETGNEVQAFQGHTAGVHGVALSPDGALAASGGDDNTVRLWDVKTGKELRQARGITDAVRCVAFSPDSRRLASGHFGPKSEFLVRVWDVATGDEVRSFKGHTKDVTAVAFLPDGRTLLSASLDGTLRLWDVETGKEVRRMAHDGGVYDAAVAPDGRRALSAGFGDRTVRLWDLKDGRELHRFEGHTAHVLGVAFSPDGRRALSSDAACTLRLWQVAR